MLILQCIAGESVAWKRLRKTKKLQKKSGKANLLLANNRDIHSPTNEDDAANIYLLLSSRKEDEVQGHQNKAVNAIGKGSAAEETGEPAVHLRTKKREFVGNLWQLIARKQLCPNGWHPQKQPRPLLEENRRREGEQKSVRSKNYELKNDKSDVKFVSEQKQIASELSAQNQQQQQQNYTYFDLFRFTRVRRHVLALMFCFCSTSFISFGLYFSAEVLPGDRFVLNFI